MSTRCMLLATALVFGLVPNLAAAQHEAHQSPSTQAPSPELTQCLRAQTIIQNVIAAAMARAETARLSNSPSDLRAALDQLEGALRDVRSQSEPCATAAASSDAHAVHTMPGMQSPPTPPAQAPAATPDAHAGHTMPGMQMPAPAQATPPVRETNPHAGHTMPSAAGPKGSATPKTTPPSKPAAAKPEEKKADPHAGHSGDSAAPSQKASGDKQMDPVNGLMVDPATAPKTTYQGQTYYFSSDQSRKEFLANPAKFAKKPKG